MRIAISVLALAAFAATPAFAAEPDRAQQVADKVAAEKDQKAAQSVAEMKAKLSDPATQKKLSAIAVAMTDAMMDMKVGGMIAAAEGREATKAEKKATVRDMVGSKSNEEQIKAAAANSGEMLTAAAGMMEVMLPKLMEAMEGMEGQMGDIVANMPRPVDPTP